MKINGDIIYINGKGHITIDCKPEHSWEELSQNLTKHEIELLDCLHSLSLQDHKLHTSFHVDKEIIDVAVDFGYNKNEIIELCKKLEILISLMDCSFLNVLHGDNDWDNVWMDEKHELGCILAERMKVDNCLEKQHPSEYLANKHGHPEWIYKNILRND